MCRPAPHPAVGLDRIDESFRRRRVAVLHEHLVEHDVVEDREAGRCSQPIGDDGGAVAGTLDEFRDTIGAERAESGPDLDLAGAL